MCSGKVFAELIWNVKNEDFWVELTQDDINYEKEKMKKLEAEIELELNSENYEIDLIDAITKGLENSNTYKISKLQKKYADWEFRNKLSEFLPTFNYDYSLTDLKGEFLVGGILPRLVHETVYSSAFSAEMQVINGRRIFEIMQLRNIQTEKKHNQNYTREDLIFRVANAYYDLLLKKFEIEIYRYNLLEVEEQYRYNQALYDIGQGVRFDILRSQSEVEGAKADLQNAILSLKIAQTNLANIAGYPIFSNLQPKEKLINKLVLIDENITPDVLYLQALSTREDVKAKQSAIKALNAKKKSNYGDFIPSISLIWESATVGTLRLGSRRNDTFGLVINAPLGRNLGLNSFTKYKMDSINYQLAKTELDKMLGDIQKNITDNYYGSKTGLEIINAKNEQIISTKEGLRQAIARMRIGEATYLDVIEANRLKTQARIEFVTAIINYNKTQLNQLKEIGGMNFMEIKTKYENSLKE